ELVEELAQHKSLRAIVEWIEGMAVGEPASAPAAPSGATTTNIEPDDVLDLDLPPASQRFEIREELLAPPVALGDLHGTALGVIEGHGGLTTAIASAAGA